MISSYFKRIIKFAEKNPQKMRQFYLGFLVLVIIYLNTRLITDFEVPIVPDEMEFMGTGNQIVFWDNIPFLDIRGYKFFSFSAIMGMLTWLLPIKMAFIYRGLHLLGMASLVVNYYRLGRVKSETLGLTLATVITLFAIPGYVYNFGVFVPTFVIYCLIPLIFKNVLEEKYRWVVYWLLWAVMIHVWFVGPIVMCIFFFELFKRKPKWGVGLFLVSMIMAWGIHDFLFESFGKKLFIKPSEMTWSIVAVDVWVILSLFGWGALKSLPSKMASKWRQFFWLGVATMTPFLFLFFLLGKSYGLIKVQVFLFFGMAILSAMGATILIEKIGLKKVIAPLIIVVGLLGVYSLDINKKITYNTIPTNLTEIRGYEWLSQNRDMTKGAVLSDWGTMRASHYYLPTINSIWVDELMFNASWNTGKETIDQNAELKPYYDFFVKADFDEADFDWLISQKEKFNAEKLYVVLTARSMQNFYYYLVDGKKRGISFSEDASSLPYPGGVKFLQDKNHFNLIYDGGLTILEVNL